MTSSSYTSHAQKKKLFLIPIYPNYSLHYESMNKKLGFYKALTPDTDWFCSFGKIIELI